jgi:hypothetical protein
MSTQQQREGLAELLDLVANGRLSATEVFSQIGDWNDVPWNERLFNHAWHFLCHYRDDEDIRQRDPAYAKSQREAPLWYAKRLRRHPPKGLLGWFERRPWWLP